MYTKTLLVGVSDELNVVVLSDEFFGCLGWGLNWKIPEMILRQCYLPNLNLTSSRQTNRASL
jgi:hypothetical protein